MIRARRSFVQALAVGGACVLTMGHTPYKQWVVYRMRHVLLGCHREDPLTYELAKAAVGVLDEHLPESSPRVARAPHAQRLASLLATGQMDVAVLEADTARAIREGSGPFAPYGNVSLSYLLPLGARALIAREEFQSRHAWLLTGALIDTELCPRDAANTAVPPIPWHAGARAFLDGKPIPPAG